MNKNRAFIRQMGTKLGWGIGKIIAIALIFALGFLSRGLFVSTPTAKTTDGHEQHVETSAEKTVWTCSMHPHIRLPKPGLCPLCLMSLIPASQGDSGDMEGMRRLTVSDNARMLMDIETVPVERKFATATIRLVGKVEYDETRLAYITAWIPGRLDRLFVDYTGVRVNKGDHMVSLYSPELLTAQEELLQALQAVKNIKDGIMREITEATVIAVREKLRLWGLTAQQIGDIEKSGKVSDHITIYAPQGGIVIHKNALEGMYVKEGTRIYTIADLSQLWVKLDAYESDLGWLRYGQKVEFTTVSYPGETFTGTIAFIDPIVNERTRTVKIRVNVPNPDGRLKPGMFVKSVVRADIAEGGRVMDADLVGKWMCPMHPEIIKELAGKCDICEMPLVTTESLGYVSDDPAGAEKPLVIPVSAALVTGTRAIVYVQLQLPGKEKFTFEGREIVLGPRAGNYYLVRSGLQEGELVVVKGNFKIDSELQIQAKPSMMSPQGSGSSGGHDHGGKPAMAQKDAAAPSVELDALVHHQLLQVIKAAKDVQAAVALDNLDAIKSAFANLRSTLQKVEMQRMTGDAHLVWMELAMRLNNDAVEGLNVNTIKHGIQTAKLLENNIVELRQKLDLKDMQPVKKRPALSKELRDQLANIFKGYFAIQSALAGDNLEAARAGAGQMRDALEAVGMELFPASAHDLWMKANGELKTVLTDTVKIDDIQLMRKNFYLLSQQMIKLSKSFGPVGAGAFYVIRCPMAFDNRGALWLQDSENMTNPYFGEMMPKCGIINEIIWDDDVERKGQ